MLSAAEGRRQRKELDVAVAGLLPPPASNIVRILGAVVLVLILISILLGETGVWIGYGHRHRW